MLPNMAPNVSPFSASPGPPPIAPRPAAPDMSFQPRPAGAPGASKGCTVCGTQNPADVRYCISCGSLLDKPAFAGTMAMQQSPPLNSKAATSIGGVAIPPQLSQQPMPPPQPPQQPYGAPPAAAAAAAPAPPAAIAPMRVVDIGGAAPPREMPRVCARCHGTSDAGASFCKFCGAPLGDVSAGPGINPSARDAAPASVRPAPIASPNPIGAASALTPAPPAAMAAPAPTPAPGPVSPGAAPPMAPAPVAPAPRPPAPGGPTPINGAPLISPVAPPVAAPVASPIAPPPVTPIAHSPISPPSAVPPTRPDIAPMAAARGRLVVVARDGGEGPDYPLLDQVDIGREEGQIVIADDGYLSPRHVRVAWRGNKLFLRDLASVNGVFLRLMAPGAPPPGSGVESSRPLEDQDLILVGQQVLRFEIVRDGEAGLGPASENGTLLFGTPTGPRYARLCQRSVEGVSRDVYYLRKMETVLGRESGDIIFTEDPFLSRRHAAVRIERAGTPTAAYSLVDLGSSNGCFIKIRGEVEVGNRDQFRIGQQLFRVELNAS
jgi:pSer/pThr/pTyr-binding forkhead associated (FHA) protein